MKLRSFYTKGAKVGVTFRSIEITAPALTKAPIRGEAYNFAMANRHKMGAFF